MRDAALETAFRATTYRVETPDGSFDLRIGLGNPAFDDFLCRQGVSSWGIVTAYNPGIVLPEAKNRLHHEQLQARLQILNWRYLAASNIADSGIWPSEPGFCLLQVEEQSLRALAAEFAQLALVYGETGSVPRLIWI